MKVLKFKLKTNEEGKKNEGKRRNKKKKKKKKKKMCMRAWAHTQSAWWRFLIRWHSRVGLMLLFEREKLAKKRAQ